jgi:hypothetical protein
MVANLLGQFDEAVNGRTRLRIRDLESHLTQLLYEVRCL